MPGPGTWSPGDILTADDLNAIGTWTSYTPTLTQGVTRTATVDYAEYCVINKLCLVNVAMTMTETGSNSALRVSVPFATVNPPGGLTRGVGSGYFFDSSASDVVLVNPAFTNTTNVQFWTDASTTSALNTTVGVDDTISFSIFYEVA